MSYQLVENLQKKACPQVAVTVGQACRVLEVNLKLGAGNDLNATAADVQAGQALRVNAGGSVLIAAGQNTNNLEEAHKTTGGGFFGGSSVVTRETRNETTSQANTFGGATNACTRHSASPKLFL